MLAASSAALPGRERARVPALAPLRIGIQLSGLQKPMRADAAATLGTLAAIGYSEVQLTMFGRANDFAYDPFFGLGLLPFKRLLDEHGLTMTTMHFFGEADFIPRAAQTALQFGATHLILPLAPDLLQRTPAGVVIGGVGDLAQVDRVYHNHLMEFAVLDGQRVYDRLLLQTDPELVGMELDVGWAQAAGVEGAAFIDAHPKRFISCHLKDYDPRLPLARSAAEANIPQMTQLVPPGDGVVDFRRVLLAMRNAGVQRGYIEVDLPRGDPIEVFRRGYQFIAALRTSRARA
jgi:sugar phosphate isomerase/epimerase